MIFIQTEFYSRTLEMSTQLNVLLPQRYLGIGCEAPVRGQGGHPVLYPVFRRSTRKVPAFSSSHFFTFSPEPRLFLYLRHIFNALWGLFLLKIFLEYSIIMVLYGTLLGGELWRTFYDRKKRKKDSICKCMTPTGTRR